MAKKGTKKKRPLALDIFKAHSVHITHVLCSGFGSPAECAFPEFLDPSGICAFLVPIHSSEDESLYNVSFKQR